MAKPKILVQLDSDPQPSVFDAVVAVDSGVDHLLQYSHVEAAQIRDLIYGAMFTRGVDDLHSTAIFIGGSDVATGETLLEQASATFFGPMRVSVMLDSNGANTTAAAAVLSASKHLSLKGARAVVLAGTGPVGSRVVRLLAGEGAAVRIGSRSVERARKVASEVASRVPGASLEPLATTQEDHLAQALDSAQLVIAAGAPGVQLLPARIRNAARALKVAIDLSAVAPLGIEGIEVTDAGREREGTTCYGAIGVGGTKMKIHKAALRSLFERNDQVLDAEEIYRIGQELIKGDK